MHECQKNAIDLQSFYLSFQKTRFTTVIAVFSVSAITMLIKFHCRNSFVANMVVAKAIKSSFSGIISDLGYANEVGEAFRPLVHKLWVHASYGVACLYIAADTVDKTTKANEREKSKPKYNRRKVVSTAVNTLVWQGLASVVIPGFTINRICALTLFSLTKFTNLPSSTKKWTTTAVGLSSIPFIVKPIDTFVDFLLDKLFRPFFVD